jgi:hypothetical protein
MDIDNMFLEKDTVYNVFAFLAIQPSPVNIDMKSLTVSFKTDNDEAICHMV